MMQLLKKISLFLLSSITIYLVVFAALFAIKVGGIPLVYRATSGQVWEGGKTYRKFKSFNENDTYDVFVLGSSHALHGYDPDVFKSRGLKMHNLGTDDQNLMCSYYLAKDYITKNNCKVVIIDVYDRVMTFQNLESISDFIQNINKEKTAAHVAMASKDIRAINMFTLRQFNKFSAPLLINKEVIKDGYIPLNYKLTKPHDEIKWRYKTNEYQLGYFDKLLSYLSNSGFKVVVVEHPLPYLYFPPEHQAFLNDINPILAKYGVKFYDFTGKSGLTDLKFFADENHLHIHGVEKYNNLLIDELSKDGIFTNTIKN
jgi:hypothetical protein